MAVERLSGGSSLIDVLDRVLDKGIVIDAWVRISLVGIDLITVEARVVVASIDTYLKYADAVGLTGLVARPQLTPAVDEVEVVEEMEPAKTRRPRVAIRRAAARR
jgi:gas vesicle structural protein